MTITRIPLTMAVIFVCVCSLCAGADGVITSVPDDRGCVIDEGPPELELTVVDLDHEQRLGEDAALQLELVSSVPQWGEAVVAATVFSEKGFTTHNTVAEQDIEPGGRHRIAVPAKALSLPTGSLDYSGRLWITVAVRFSDGSRGSLRDPIELFFHPRPGGWLVYTQATRDTRYERGVLSSKARALTKNTDTSAAGIGPALVDKGAHTSRQPRELDGPPDVITKPRFRQHTKQSPMYPLVFCIDQISTFTDAGIGEDYWTNSTPTARKARGAHFSLYQGGTLRWSGYLGDGMGTGDPGLACTPELSGGMDAVVYQLVLLSKAEVQGNQVQVVDEGIGLIRSSSAYVAASQGTYNVTLSPVPDEFNVCAVGAYALYRHAGGLTGQIFSYSIGRATGSSFDRNTDTLLIKDTHHHLKFLLIHETGHALGDYATGNLNHKLVGTNCEDFSSTSCPASGGDHSMTSKEYAKCALGEGFANFYSADVFNSHDEVDCFFEYYKNEFGTDSTPLVDCENANGDFVLRYMETNCALAYAGFGTELDWLRALWDLHTDSDTAPGFTEIVQWLDATPVWGNQDTFDLLDLEAEHWGGALDAHWDVAKTRNGIDWPVHGYLLFADDLESGGTSRWSATTE